MATIKHLFHIAAPQQEVFKAIATVEGLKSWWTTNVTGTSEPGQTLAFRFNTHGPDLKVLGLDENQSVEWECVAGSPEWMGTMVSLRLDQNEGKTRVRFEHNGWKETNDHYAAINFSWSRYMESLRQYLQTGTGTPFNG